MTRQAKIAVVTVVVLSVALGIGLYLFIRHRQAVLKTRTTVPVLSTVVPNLGSGVGPGPGKYWHHDGVLLPNPQLTPGEVRTTDKAVICGESAQDFRDTSEKLKRQVYDEYDTAPHQGTCADTTRMTKGSKKHPPHQVTEACEVDHVISLELGGADTEANLFPQPYNPGVPGAHSKDQVENWLHRQVCDGSISVEDAQKAIAKDWYQVYLDNHLGR
jgi:hypothetical protein